MKHFNKAMMSILLALTLILGAMALAETAEVPTLEPVPEQAEAPAEAPAEADATDDSAALRDAMDAYRSAKQESRQSDRRAALEEELKGYVEAGKLTQEQADLILNDFDARAQQRADAKNDRSASFGRGNRKNGKGGRMNGGKGNRMMGGCDGCMMGDMNDRMMGGRGGRMMGGMNDRMMGNAAPQGTEIAPEMTQPEMGPDGI